MSARRDAVVAPMPGLDGIRALAVAAVFLFHAEVSWLPGGFLGVDVFFVLSGYLITALLVAERARTGAISLGDFWRRRIRRLVPALLTTVVGTVVLAAILAPGQLDAARASAIAALLDLANWHDITAHVPYFSQFGRPPLLRHLWSLSVEEQFYLLWPPVVLVLLGLGPRRLRRRNLGLAALALAFASGLEMWLLGATASITRVYEGTDTRAATLLIGALLAIVLPPARIARFRTMGSPVVANVVGVGCLAGLIYLMTVLDQTGSGMFHGPLVLAGLLSAGLLIATVAPGGVLGWCFSRPIPRWIGRRSYGIYLWHWPIIALSRPVNAGYGQSVTLTLLQAIATLAAAAAMFALVEDPIRRHGLAPIRAAVERLRMGLAPRQLAATALLAIITVPLVYAVGLAHATSHPEASPIRSLHGVVSATRRRSQVTAPPVAAGPRRHSARGSSTPAGTSPVAGAPSGGPAGGTMVFGDSVVIGAAPALTRALGSGTRFNAVIGRQPQDTVAAVAATGVAGELPDRVVVSLGDNGLVTTTMLEALRRDLTGVPDVVLVTPRVPDAWGPESAAVIRAASRWWPSVHIADWEALSANENDWFTDGIHPDPAGVEAYVALVQRALDDE